MKKIYRLMATLCILNVMFLVNTYGSPFSLQSPDGKTVVTVTLNDYVCYSVTRNRTIVLLPSPIALTVKNGIKAGYLPQLVSTKTKADSQVIVPVYHFNQTIVNKYQEFTLNFKGDYSIIFRAYDDAVAYRFVTRMKGNVVVENELVRYQLPMTIKGWFPNWQTYETPYTYKVADDSVKKRDLFLPLVIEGPGKVKLAFTEADVADYPSLFLRKSNDYENHLVGNFQKYPTKLEQGGYNGYVFEVKGTADCIAQTSGTRNFPWRVMVIAENDGLLASSDIVYRLGRPQTNMDFSWVKPGKVQWDWWADYVIEGVNFVTGVNTDTYLYNIDFASKHGIEYIIVDWRWTDRDDLTLINPNVDIQRIIIHGKQKNVGVILWCPSYTIFRQMEKVMPLFAGWGAAGVKVDFFERDDQLAIQMYEALASCAAKNKLLIDFHGCTKPTGLERMYPNIINYEAVHGNEVNKWASTITPEHKALLPFVRFLAGPADFTPGGMRNCNKDEFAPRNTLALTQGTRCSEMALYVLYYEPLKMFCDAPSSYAKEPSVLDFLVKIPTIWDETKVLQASVSDYLIIARRTKNTWYIAGITDDTPRNFTIDLSILTPGNHKMLLYSDGPNASHFAVDYQYSEKNITRADNLEVKMSSGGGFVCRIE